MKHLTIDLEYCFGIGKLKHTFDFEQSNSYLIYAPNGTMKTSFAKTFDLISKNDKKNLPKDRIYTKKVKHEILVDGETIKHNNILVVNAEDNSFDASNRITSFIASKELKDKYDIIHLELTEAKNELLKGLKSISKSSDCEGELLGSFNKTTTNDFFEVISENIDELDEKANKITFKYNDVFDTKGNVEKFLNKNTDLLDDYIQNYNEIISDSKLFKNSEDIMFGTYQVNEILKSIEDNSYFKAGHSFLLEDGTEIKDVSVLKEILEEEVKRILADEKLKQSFDKVDKAIGANVELRSFKKVIEKDNSLLVGLKDYSKFKQTVWINYLSQLKDETEKLSLLYNKKKEELEEILKEAKKETDQWNSIIDKFNSRFYVPFEVRIGNHQDVILKQETAILEFIFKDKKEEDVIQAKDSLLKILSKGEQRAYFILQFLFEIESRKFSEDKTLLIFDDVADSFDYKNKYAIIEYIRDLHCSDKFKSLILTHNFDFYRTIASRLGINKQTLMATKDEHRKIELVKGLYINDVFKDYAKKHKDPKIFISLISFVRNLIEYSDSTKAESCILLTACLHQKETSSDITINEVFEVFKDKIVKIAEEQLVHEKDAKIQDFIFQTADNILDEASVNEMLLENKITLAIASRLKAEQYMISKLNDFDLESIKFNQTRALSEAYKSKYSTSSNLDTIDRVNLMTPENIHINAFMFEPLIDMSVYHLIDLYKSLKDIA